VDKKSKGVRTGLRTGQEKSKGDPNWPPVKESQGGQNKGACGPSGDPNPSAGGNSRPKSKAKGHPETRPKIAPKSEAKSEAVSAAKAEAAHVGPTKPRMENQHQVVDGKRVMPTFA